MLKSLAVYLKPVGWAAYRSARTGDVGLPSRLLHLEGTAFCHRREQAFSAVPATEPQRRRGTSSNRLRLHTHALARALAWRHERMSEQCLLWWKGLQRVAAKRHPVSGEDWVATTPLHSEELRKWLEGARLVTEVPVDPGADAAWLLATWGENGAAARLQAVRTHANLLIASLTTDGTSPAFDVRDEQEGHLFGLVSNASSTFSCLAVWMYAHACRVAPDLSLARALEMYPGQIHSVLKVYFPGEPFVTALHEVTKHPTFRKIAQLRNALDHRGQPGRAFDYNIGTDQPPFLRARMPLRSLGKLPGELPEWDLNEVNLREIVTWVEETMTMLVESSRASTPAVPDPGPDEMARRRREVRRADLQRLAVKVAAAASDADSDRERVGLESAAKAIRSAALPP